MVSLLLLAEHRYSKCCRLHVFAIYRYLPRLPIDIPLYTNGALFNYKAHVSVEKYKMNGGMGHDSEMQDCS